MEHRGGAYTARSTRWKLNIIIIDVLLRKNENPKRTRNQQQAAIYIEFVLRGQYTGGVEHPSPPRAMSSTIGIDFLI